jgi:hypothetical protein
MAKDAKGHGSDGRGANSQRASQIAFTKAAGKDITPTQRQWLALQSPEDHAAADALVKRMTDAMHAAHQTGIMHATTHDPGEGFVRALPGVRGIGPDEMKRGTKS